MTTLLFRGEALTPDGLSQMDALLNGIVTEPGVGELLTPTDPVISPSLLYQVLLQSGRLWVSHTSGDRLRSGPA